MLHKLVLIGKVFITTLALNLFEVRSQMQFLEVICEIAFARPFFPALFCLIASCHKGGQYQLLFWLDLGSSWLVTRSIALDGSRFNNLCFGIGGQWLCS